MNDAIYSISAARVTPPHRPGNRWRSSGQSLWELRGIAAAAGIASGTVFLLVRASVYLLALLLSAATCLAGVALYGLGAVFHRLAGSPVSCGIAAPRSPQAVLTEGHRTGGGGRG